MLGTESQTNCGRGRGRDYPLSVFAVTSTDRVRCYSVSLMLKAAIYLSNLNILYSYIH